MGAGRGGLAEQETCQPPCRDEDVGSCPLSKKIVWPAAVVLLFANLLTLKGTVQFAGGDQI